MIGSLPDTLTVSGKKYDIRTDYRNVLQVFEALADPELDDTCRVFVSVYLLFEGFPDVDSVYDATGTGFDLEEAMDQIAWFISGGNVREKKEDKPTYNWAQDEQMIFSAINKVAGKEVREVEYMHWWTFLGLFHEIGDGTFSYVVGIRSKLNQGKKLDKSEREFLERNKDMVIIRPKLTEEEQEKEDEFQKLLDDILG